MKTAFLLLTLSASALATQEQQWKVCKSHSDCNQGFYCRPTDDGKFAMCQPGDKPATDKPATDKPTAAPGKGDQWANCKADGDCKDGLFCRPTDDKKFSMCQPKGEQPASNGNGKQWSVCTKNGDCGKGLFCKPTNDGKFAMCQPNEGCANLWQQCGGKSYSGASCCGNGNACKVVNEWYSQCVPASHAMESEASCTNVSVEGDATYCIQGAICGGAGDQCPKKGDVAVADCIKTLTSYTDGAKCVAPADATCQVIKTGAKGCVFGKPSSAAPTTAAPAQTTAAPTTAAATTAAPTTGAPSNATTAAPANNGQCAENHSQCNGQNWPFGVCCKDPKFECNKKNDYLSLCEPKKQAMEGQAGEVAVWQQCGGNGYNGDKTCATGTACTKINDWYSQCQPTATPAGRFNTYEQCDGSANGFSNSAKKTCRDEDKCQKYSDAYSQCVPKSQKMSAEAAEVAVWGQCDGKDYKGDKNCAANTKCTKINDWYSQCQPDNSAPKDNQFPTWAQCGGKNNNFNANGKTCRDADKCEHYNEWFWQCIPK